VTADKTSEGADRAIMFTERVSISDFESDHFQAQLVERLGWAVGDAHAVEQQGTSVEEQSASHEPPAPAGGAQN
jgi:hypothetical protein